MRHKTLKNLLLLSVLSAPAAAGAQLNPVTGAVNDIGRAAASPARLERGDLLPLAGVIGGGLLLYSMDGQIRAAARRSRTKTLDDISKQAEKLGNGGYDLGITAAGWLAGRAFSDEKLQRVSLLAAESFLAANGIGTVGKYVAGRSRPYTGESKATFHPFNFKTARTSFPSGHSVSAFSVASVYAASYDSLAVKAAAYGLAGAVALQRVYSDKHWASDVFFGAALGTAMGRMVARKGAAAGETAASVYPLAGNGFYGAEAAVKF